MCLHHFLVYNLSLSVWSSLASLYPFVFFVMQI
jgi:hypothetical protein